MMWRVALTLMAVASLTCPAAAQWYPGWEGYSDRPYYGPSVLRQPGLLG